MADEATAPIEPTKTPTAEPVAAPVVAPPADPLDAKTLLTGGDAPAEGEGDKAVAPIGAPEAYDLKAPEGSQGFDTEAFAIAEPVLRELNLTNEQAQKVVDVYPALMQRAADEAGKSIIADVVAQRAAWETASRADPEIGGTPEHHATVINTAAKALDKFGGAEFRSFLNETGLGNHPDMIRFAFRAGSAISEDTDFYRSDAAVAPKKTREEKYYPTVTT